jgi:hypothetical protein
MQEGDWSQEAPPSAHSRRLATSVMTVAATHQATLAAGITSGIAARLAHPNLSPSPVRPPDEQAALGASHSSRDCYC